MQKCLETSSAPHIYAGREVFPWLKHQQNCWDLRWWNLPGGENSFVLLLDIFQAVQSEGAGSSLAVISVVILRKSVSSYAKDTEAKARPLPDKVLVLSMTLKNTISLFFRTQLLWPEKLCILSSEQQRKKLCCLLGIQGTHRELSFIS